MSNNSQHGYLLLADISGFVPFLAGVELEHAQAILEELFELITRCAEPALCVSERTGGALLAYAPATLLNLAKGKNCRRSRVCAVRGRENGKKEVKFSPKRMPCLPISIIRVVITQ